MKELNPAIRCKPWRSTGSPRKILAIRFQATGDVVITLPYLLDLKESVPEAKIHLLTRHEVSDIPENLDLFDKVIRVGGGRNAKMQFALAVLLLPYLWYQRYDVVLDLQNHKISRVLRTLLFPSCWSEFDRSSRVPAGERTRQTIEAIQVGDIGMKPVVVHAGEPQASRFLVQNGWDGKGPLVVLNPAGAFITRNWPLENYLSFARQWAKRVEPQAFFVFIGTSSLSHKAVLFRSELKEKFIDLTGKTTPFEAFSLVGKVNLMLTEDSGLMHMAWVQGVPTVALFGSSPAYWSAPLGEWSQCLSSSDLPCGNCFSETCQFGDVHCLTRYTPAWVVEAARTLLLRSQKA